jgi:GT2 family glycosyltransferase
LDEGYFPAYFEETDYCFRARRAGYRVIYVPGAVVYHHESVGLKKFSRRFYYHYHRNRIRFVLKNYSLKDFALKFALSEVHWLRRYTPKEQIEPLVRAYLANLISIGDTVASRARQGH